MKLSWDYIDLRLRHPFTISRSSKVTEPCIIVKLEHDGIVGYGEAAPSERYGETRETVIDFLENVDIGQFEDPLEIERILTYTASLSPRDTSAKASIDIALYDWLGKRVGLPLWKLLGLSKDRTPRTSFTIGIDTIPIIEKKVQEAEKYPILKVKVGIPNDEEIIMAIRRMTSKTIRVDANEGWKIKEQARDKILWLEEQGIEFVEQPMPAAQAGDIAWLREQVHIPLIADESIVTLRDLHRLQGVFDGINIKLMKCTGLREALRLIHAARSMNMKVMLGCMIESSVAVAAAMNLSPLVDYADLDGNLLITNDPFCGTEVADGKLVLNDHPGLGVLPRTS